MSDTIEVSGAVFDALKKWADKGLSIGIWQNAALDHSMLGHQVFICIGEGCTYPTENDMPDRMPDGAGGIGVAWAWRKDRVIKPDEFSEVFVQETEE